MKSLWGTLPDVSKVRTPAEILKEQAAALADETNHILEGKVDITQREQQFWLTLRIIAPLLNGYSYAVVSVEHGIDLYPATIKPGPREKVCNTEAELLAALEENLRSERVHRVIAALLAQSRAAS